MGLDEKCFILVGVGPLASAKTARWMRANVAGVHIPDEVIARLEGAKNQKAEGKRICVEMIQPLREIPGVAGVHVMAYRQEEYVSEIVHESGVLRVARRGGATSWPRCRRWRAWGRDEGDTIAFAVFASEAKQSRDRDAS